MEEQFKLLTAETSDPSFSEEDTIQQQIIIISEQASTIIKVNDNDTNDGLEDDILAEDEAYSKERSTDDDGSRQGSEFVVYEDDAETENISGEREDDVDEEKTITEQTSTSDLAEYNQVCRWITELTNDETKVNALEELGVKYHLPYLAPLLWNSFGTITVLLQEIMSIYPEIFPPTLTIEKAHRACNAVALLQSVVSHPETKMQFIAAWIPLYIIPFFKYRCTTEAIKFVQLGCLGCIAGMVKPADAESVIFLLSTDIIPFCLRIMEEGPKVCKMLATFIMERILYDYNGLAYMCENYYRFRELAMVLGKMVISIAAEPEAALLKYIIRCYINLAVDPRAKIALRISLPDQLKDNTFTIYLNDDLIKFLLTELLTDLEFEFDDEPVEEDSPNTTSL